MPAEWPKLLRAVRASLQVASLLYGPGSGMGAVSGPRLGRSQVRGWGRPSRSAGQVGVFQAPQSIQCGPTLHRSGPLTITTLQKNPMVKPAHARGSHFRGKWTCARSDVRSRRQQIRALACPATRQGRSIWRRSRIRGSRPNSRRGHLDHLIAQVGDHGEDLIEALLEEFRHLIRPAS